MFKHNHTNRNNLDTRPVFIEFLKHVENSDVVVYFKIASNREELLAGDDI